MARGTSRGVWGNVQGDIRGITSRRKCPGNVMSRERPGYVRGTYRGLGKRPGGMFDGNYVQGSGERSVGNVWGICRDPGKHPAKMFGET